MPEITAFDPNQRLGLIAVDDADRKGEVSAALQELGFRVHLAASVDDGRDRLRKASYDIVVIDQTFQGGTPLDNPLLQLLQLMPMATRRYMVVALLARGVETLDNMTAFMHSVNVVVNHNDVGQIKRILERVIAENDHFFRVIRSVLHETGRH
jgi:DNA-binding NtrC family response regulator